MRHIAEFACISYERTLEIAAAQVMIPKMKPPFGPTIYLCDWAHLGKLQIVATAVSCRVLPFRAKHHFYDFCNFPRCSRCDFPLAFRLFALFCLLISMTTHTFASDFADFDRRAGAGEKLRVVFLGGSLTWGAQATDPQVTSYRALMSQSLEERYPQARFRFWDAAIGGTTSQLGAFRLERDVLARKPDLVFLDFTVNDGPHGEPDPDKLAAYEAIVRRLVSDGVPVVQAIFAVKKDVLPGAKERPLDAAHKAIAQAYGLPSGDAVTLMRARVEVGEATAEELWDCPPDVTHPGDKGYALYAEAVWAAYEKAVADKQRCHLPETMLHADTYMTVSRVRLSSLGPLPEGWSVGQPHRNAVAFDFVMSRWADDMTIAQGPKAQPLTLKVRGKNVLLFGDGTPISGRYEVRVNGGEPKIYEPGQHAKGGNFRHVQFIAQNLAADREHVIEITPLLEEGQELRIESVCVAGSPAAVGVLK
jgi:lysophospholipase L1-like esterase